MQVSIVYPAQTGAQADYSIPFEYLSASHVKATVGGVDTPFTFNSTYVIHFATNPVGDVHIYRETPSDVPWTTFVDGSVLVSDELNGSFLQSLYVSQEVLDKLPKKTADGYWDAGNLKWQNAADPSDPKDLTTKSYVDGLLPLNQSYADTATSKAAEAASSAAAAAASQASALASKNASATSEGNAAASATSAAGSASSASTSAATATAKASAASTSEANAAASASTATAKAAEASTSEANAAASASAAHSSELNAAASAAAAQTWNPANYLPHYASGAPLPTSNIGPIWHDDYAAIMTWDGVGYASLGVGESRMFAFDAVPAGYLEENGAAVSRTVYAGLFRRIGTTWGAGDGSTTFNLPETRGEHIRAFDNGRGVDSGRTFASWQDSQNRWHQHTGGTSWAGDHSHGLPTQIWSNLNGGLYVSTDGGGYWFNNVGGQNTFGAGGHSHSFTTDASGGSETRVRTVTRKFCIKF